MLSKELHFALADVWMIAVGLVYGIKFIRHHRNYLLGIEWLIMATSGTNFLIYGALGGDHDSPMYSIAYFLDAFSRSIGFTLILVLGLMKVTHRYKPSVATDLGAFTLAAVAGFILFHYADALGTAGKIVFLVTAALTTTYLAYFIARLWAIGERGHAAWVALSTAANIVIAGMYDFVHIPGDDANRTLFYTLALLTWGLAMFTLYRAYRAFDTHNRSAAALSAAPREPHP
ncbi:transporter [Mycobacterium sp.]|uniref:transporter n=1 Tax=Mycobacterium sp. TaxID=1785 RepID=UPI0025DB6F54|nr:transporter [Mycobacterium sp.]